MATTYTVTAGDTLGKIATKFYGSSSKYTLIVAANKLSNPDKISVGQQLIIPDLPGSSEQGTGSIATSQPTTTNDSDKVTLTSQQLKQIMPYASTANIDKYLDAFNTVLPKDKINTPMRVAQFLAQIGHESGSLAFVEENLNYKASALMAVFGKYFPTETMANEYAHQPEKIANLVYANRMGNGNEASGDGWKYRGRGLIQLTGKNNYSACGKDNNLDLISDPSPLAKNADMAIMAATWFWNVNNLNQLADADDVKAITKRINGGYNGLSDREAFLARAKTTLGI